MSRNSLADLLRDWELLLTMSEDLAEELPGTEAHRFALAVALAEVKTLHHGHTKARAFRQEATRELNLAMVQGRDLAMCLRGAVKARLGEAAHVAR